MKKSYFGLPLFYYLAIFLFALLCVLFGSFFDYSLSKAFVSLDDPLGNFFETMGQGIGYLTIPFGAVMVLKSLWKQGKKGFKIVGVVLFVIAVFMSVYTLGDAMNEKTHIYGILFSPFVAYLVSVIINAFFLLIAFLIFRNEYSKEMAFVGLIFLLGCLFQWLLIKLLKKIDCRPRFRYLISDRNTNGEVFRSWWEMTPFRFRGDDHYSAPSGHSATFAQLLMLPAIAPFLKRRFKNDSFYYGVIGVVLTLFVMVMRIRVGAHFLSDVGGGLLVGSLLDFILLLLFSIQPKKKEETEETDKNKKVFSKKKEGNKTA